MTVKQKEHHDDEAFVAYRRSVLALVEELIDDLRARSYAEIAAAYPSLRRSSPDATDHDPGLAREEERLFMRQVLDSVAKLPEPPEDEGSEIATPIEYQIGSIFQ